MWHSVSGLVVSPFNRTLPSAVVSNPKSTRPDDLTNPRLLQDDNIYLAFYPRRAIHRGTLFSVLSIRSDLLSNSIMPVTESSGTESSRYALDPSIQSRWKTLETPLLQVAQTLYAAHPDKANFPPLLYPRWPHQYGYEDSHRTKELAYDCAKKSLAAFSMLVAFTTFVLSLWLTEYEDDCFAAAFAVLAQRHRDGLPRVWLEYLKDSIVGDLSPGLRPGGFLNPYSTRWGAYLLRFTRASVPFWLLWGTDDIKHAHLADRKIDYFFPPREYIELAKQRCLTFSNTILPHEHTYQFEGGDGNLPASGSPLHFPDLPTDESDSNAAFGLQGFVFDNGDAFVDSANPDEPPPPAPVVDREICIEAGSGQLPRESWEAFFARETDRYKLRKQAETEKDRQRRESWEKEAQRGPTNRSKVYLWEQDDLVPTFYRRTRVVQYDALSEWEDCTQYQRFFWGHRNEWDLCPHLPAYPPHVAPPPPPPHYDPESDEEGPILGAYIPPANRIKEPLGPIMQQAVERLTSIDDEPEDSTFRHDFWSLPDYLHYRHGFAAGEFPTSWNPSLHTHPKRPMYILAQTKVDVAIKNLGHVAAREEKLTSIVDFHNTAMNQTLSYTSLPAPWDISRHPQPSSLYCKMRRIDLRRVASALFNTTELYILRPPPNSSDPSSWFIATTSATAVLMVYRSEWNTMFEIGQGLLEYGVPFHTVVERKRQDVQKVFRSRATGLGQRPEGFKPERADFAAYESARDDILRSRSGRAIRLLGGIVGRMAAEIVPDCEVLDGPYLTNVVVVGTHGDQEFVDDAVEQHELDVVSGVYHVDGKFKEVSSHMSWWPKHATFLSTGYAGDQWLPRAEDWYQTRRDELRSGKLTLLPSSKWEKNHKFNAAQVSELCKGSERMAAEFISKSSRVS